MPGEGPVFAKIIMKLSPGESRAAKMGVQRSQGGPGAQGSIFGRYFASKILPFGVDFGVTFAIKKYEKQNYFKRNIGGEGR